MVHFYSRGQVVAMIGLTADDWKLLGQAALDEDAFVEVDPRPLPAPDPQPR